MSLKGSWQPHHPMHPEDVYELAVASILPPVLSLIVSATLSAEQRQWFGRLRKPIWVPPPVINSAVFSAVLFLSGIALWLVWTTAKSHGGLEAVWWPAAAYLFSLTLVNAWPVLVFHGRKLELATFCCVLLLGSEMATLILFSQVIGVPGASLLLAPLMLWTAAATLLSYALVMRNPFFRKDEDENPAQL